MLGGETEESGEDQQQQQEPHGSLQWELRERERERDVVWPGDSHQLRGRDSLPVVDYGWDQPLQPSCQSVFYLCTLILLIINNP